MKQSIGEFLATLRRAHGYTQQEVADRLSVSNRTVSAWERGAAMPDILLLPALAELYGVTADEILAGERNAEAAPRPALSEKSERKLLKKKMNAFFMRSSILFGAYATGLLLFFLGLYVDFSTVVWVGWRWWLLLLILGLVTFLLCAVCILALWRNAENSADEEAEGYGAYCLLLRRRVGVLSAVSAGISLLFGGVCLVPIVAGTVREGVFAASAAVFFLFAIGKWLFGGLLAHCAERKFGGEAGAQIAARNAKRYKKTALFGLLPCAVALALVITLSLVNVTTRDLLYSSDRASFRRYMESVDVGGGEYSVPLSELSEGLGTGIEYGKQYQFDEHITYCFDQDFCTVQISEGIYESVIIRAERLTAEDGFFVYDLRKGIMGDVTIGGDTVVEMYDAIRTEGDAAFYERVFVENFRTLGWALGAAILLADGVICLLVCLIGRERLKVKL